MKPEGNETLQDGKKSTNRTFKSIHRSITKSVGKGKSSLSKSAPQAPTRPNKKSFTHQKQSISLSSSGEHSPLVTSEKNPNYFTESEPELEKGFAMFQENPHDTDESSLLRCLNCFCLRRNHAQEPVKIISSEDLYAMLDECSPPKKQPDNRKGSYLTNKD